MIFGKYLRIFNTFLQITTLNQVLEGIAIIKKTVIQDFWPSKYPILDINNTQQWSKSLKVSYSYDGRVRNNTYLLIYYNCQIIEGISVIPDWITIL